MTMDDKLGYNVPEAGRLLGLSRQSAYEAARRGELPTVGFGRRLIVPKVALERLLGAVGRSAADGD